MTRPRRERITAFVTLVRLAAAGLALVRLARAARRAPPITPAPASSFDAGIDVVVPARDEAARIGPLLDAVVGAPAVGDVIVVDDGSTDATADVARRAGARVVPGADLPDGWAGKAWALQQGYEAATSAWVVALDADTRPDPRLPAALVARADAEQLDLLTVAGRFDCPTPGLRWLHPALLTTLVYRFGPAGAAASRPARTIANGQCTVVRRAAFVAGGAMTPVAAHTVEDVALARHLAERGGRVAFLDASALLTVRMYESLGDAWHGWGRSLALPGIEPVWRQLGDLAIVVIAQVLPFPRLLLRRGDAIDVVLAAARLGTLAGTAPAYARRGLAYWCSPLADGLASVALARGIVSRRQTWRGRDYAVRRAPPARSGSR